MHFYVVNALIVIKRSCVMKSIFLASTLLLLLSACSDSIHSTIQDVKSKNQTSAIIKSEVIGASSEAPQDIILSGGKETFYAVLDKDYKLQVGDRVKLSCDQLRVKTFGNNELLYSSHCKLVE